MPISTKKFNTFTFNHSSQVDDLYTVMDTTTMKADFDSRAEQVRVALVGTIDNLLSTANGDSGASNIGCQPIEGLAGATVYDVLMSVKTALLGVSAGAIVDGTLTNAKLSTDVKIGSLASLTQAPKTSVTDALNNLLILVNNAQTLANALASGKVDTAQVVSTATPGKLLLLNAFGKFDADASSVNSKTASGTLTTTEQTNLVTAINELLTSINTLVTKVGTPTSYYSPNTVVKRDASTNIFAMQFFAMASTGTIPIAVFSTTMCPSLNADMLDGYHASDIMNSEAMHNVTFQNAWVNSGGSDATAQYYIDTMGVVHLQGLIKSGTLPGVAFTLPAGYRPALNQGFCTISSGNTPAYVRIVNDGTVNILTGNNAWVTLNGITFRAGY